MNKLLINLAIITLLLTAAFTAPLTQPALIPETGFLLDFHLANVENVSTLPKFVDQVATSGDPDQVAGVFLTDILELPVVQQPPNNPGFVSSQPDIATQFGMVNQFGSVALLAHNNLAGAKFFDLKIDQILTLVFGDGKFEYYRIVKVLQYQALSPNSPYSSFIDLSDPEQNEISVTNMFYSIYGQPDQLILQTCIEANGQSSWGRLFIIAVPVVPFPSESIM